MPSTEQHIKAGRYEFRAIEARWQRHWADHATFKTTGPGQPGFDASKPKFYVLDMFPYPSGAGLHVGHPLGYCATDIVARYKRMCGFNVLHPMGFDAFGLPAEQYAVEHNVHPAETTKANLETYRRQLKMFGFSYDWDRELATCTPDYYKFTQWIFLQLFHAWYDAECAWTDRDGRRVKGRARPIGELLVEMESGRWGADAALAIVREAESEVRREWSDLDESDRKQFIARHRLAYLADVPVNWCPALGTVLSNEEVDNEGRSERGRHPVFRRPLKQWMLRITSYADRLIGDLDDLDWPDPIILMQRNWIGRSTGAEVVFPLADHWRVEQSRWVCTDASMPIDGTLSYDRFPHAICVYTTRPDTLFGATYMVLAPEHELVAKITTDQQRSDVQAYVKAAGQRSELERTAESKEKTGVFTGAYAVNPTNGRKVPIWIADYVLSGYGTGAIMAVPGSDTRDFEFAVKFDLPIVCVVRPTAEWIAEKMRSMCEGLDQAARGGFDAVCEAFPELSDAVESARRRSEDLGAKTIATLEKHVGLDRLTDHYVAHPRSWHEAFAAPGIAVQSPGQAGVAEGFGETCVLDDLPTAEAKEKIIAWLEAKGVGRRAVNYKLRDWLFSRQRYWGEPFPMLIDEDGDPIALDEDALPVELPPVADFKPEPCDDPNAPLKLPLSKAPESWRVVPHEGRSLHRDLNTMPQWAGSCWYYLRFIDPKNPDAFCDRQAERYWMPIDLYVGGAEHAVLHLLYARFWHKVLYDLGHVSTPEPFGRLFNQGMIQSFAYRDAKGSIVPLADVEPRADDVFIHTQTGERVERIVAKMSKSLKNVVNPDRIIAEYGADTFRLYEMYMGPLDASKPWNTRDVPGLFKLCQRIWRLVIDEQTGALSAALVDRDASESQSRVLHKTIRRVTEDIEQLKFNTAIAALFEFVNAATRWDRRPRSIIEPFVLMFAPFAPHLAEELWRRLGHEATLTFEYWPVLDPALAADDEVEIAVQVQGKIKARIMVAADADEETVRSAALADAGVQGALDGKTIRKVIVVKGRLVNIIAG
jgi:leucyl-tRNA synthetase